MQNALHVCWISSVMWQVLHRVGLSRLGRVVRLSYARPLDYRFELGPRRWSGRQRIIRGGMSFAVLPPLEVT
jgi:hypothetical protein